MVALNYLPIIEVGRRRRNIPGEDAGQPMTAEVTEKRRRERRRTRAGVKEEDQNMELVMHPGEVVGSIYPNTVRNGAEMLIELAHFRSTPSNSPSPILFTIRFRYG